MSSSAKKVSANRINGQKSHGPKDTSSTRFNATKHGLLAVGITELDDAEGYRTILSVLTKEKSPVGLIETFLVESIALEIVRCQRARSFEARCITAVANPPVESAPFMDFSILNEPTVVDHGLPALVTFENVQALSAFQRYESTFAAMLFRNLHELERLQRIRQGEHVPAPAIVDVNVQTDKGTAVPIPAATAQLEVLPGDAG